MYLIALMLDEGGAVGFCFFLLFLGDSIRKFHQLLQKHLAYADDFSAGDVVQ